MPVYLYICECGYEKDIISSHSSLVNPCCPNCNIVMKRNYAGQEVKFVLNGLGWSRHGHCNDIDDAEEEMKKRGEPVGSWVGNWCKTDPNTGKAKIDRSHVKKKNKIAFSLPRELEKNRIDIATRG